MQRFIFWFGLVMLAGFAAPAQAQNISQGDITGTQVWNNNPPIFDVDAPEIQDLINRIELFNDESETVYLSCSAALDDDSGPRRYARPDSPNASKPLPPACARLIELERESITLRQEVTAIEEEYGNPDFLIW